MACFHVVKIWRSTTNRSEVFTWNRFQSFSSQFLYLEEDINQEISAMFEVSAFQALNGGSPAMSVNNQQVFFAEKVRI